MALKITTNLLKKQTGEYWLITGVVLSFWDNTTVINYGLWENQASAVNKEEPLGVFQDKITGTQNTEVMQQLISGTVNPKSLAYNHLKTKVKYPVDFSLAEDN